MNGLTASVIVTALMMAALTPMTISAQKIGKRIHYNHRELKQRLREARTAADYKALAIYFRFSP